MPRFPVCPARCLSGALLPTLVLLGCGQPSEPSHDKGPAPTAAVSSGPTVTGADPASSVRDTTLDVRVLGSGFDQGSSAAFALDGVVGPGVRTNRTTYKSSKELVANITIAADATPDKYDIMVATSSGKKGIGTERFEVLPGLVATVTTTGVSPDPDGYTVVAYGTGSLPVGVNGTVAFVHAKSTHYTVALTGVARNCSVAGSPRDVQVAASGPSTTTFNVVCTQPPAQWPDQLVYVSPGGSGLEFFTLDLASGQSIKLTDFGHSSGSGAASPNLETPAWNRDGTMLAGGGTRGGKNVYDVYVFNADGTGGVNLTNSPGYDWFPAWSPDGRRLAFESGRDGNYEIYLINADGTGLKRLTNDPNKDLHPFWSPDGTRIAFTSNRTNANLDIYVMNADGTNIQRLTTDPGTDQYPRWSPDGSRIAYESAQEGSLQIFVMNPDGSGKTNVSRGTGFEEELPTWSSDGNRIVFQSDRTGSLELYMAELTTGAVTQLTNNNAFHTQSAWRPR